MTGVQTCALPISLPGETVRFTVRGPDFATGRITQTTLLHTVENSEPETDRASAAGLFLMAEGDRMLMEEPVFGTYYQSKLKGFDFYGSDPVEVVSLQSPADRMPAQLFYLPALLLLAVVIMFQRRRQTQPAF